MIIYLSGSLLRCITDYDLCLYENHPLKFHAHGVACWYPTYKVGDEVRIVKMPTYPESDWKNHKRDYVDSLDYTSRLAGSLTMQGI